MDQETAILARSRAEAERRRRRRQGRRRLLVLVLGVAAVVTVVAVLVVRPDGGKADTGGTALSTADAPPPVWVATSSRPARVWIGGDSLAGELVWGLSPLLKGTGAFKVSSFYKESSGICRYDYFHWGRKMASVMEKVRPHAVAFMIGANDTQSVWTADGWIRYGTQEWEDAYGRRVGKLMDIMLDRGARRIYWVGMPIMRDSWRNRRMRLINRICRAQAQQRSGVRYVDIWALFCDTDGHYLAKWRGSDGVHFSLSGAQRLGKRVFRFVKADWLAADTTPSPAASSSATAAPSTSAST